MGVFEAVGWISGVRVNVRQQCQNYNAGGNRVPELQPNVRLCVDMGLESNQRTICVGCGGFSGGCSVRGVLLLVLSNPVVSSCFAFMLFWSFLDHVGHSCRSLLRCLKLLRVADEVQYHLFLMSSCCRIDVRLSVLSSTSQLVFIVGDEGNDKMWHH